MADIDNDTGEESDSPAEFNQRNDPRHTTPFALPVECIDMKPQHILFVEEYLTSNNATQAAKKAGYSPDSAHDTGSDLLKRSDIQAYTRARMSQIVQRSAVNMDFLQAELIDTYQKAKGAVPIYNKKGDFTGEYAFDGRTAVACLLALASLSGNTGKKDDGRSQRPFNIAIILGTHNPEAARRVTEHYGMAPIEQGAAPKVPGFPKIAFHQPPKDVTT